MRIIIFVLLFMGWAGVITSTPARAQELTNIDEYLNLPETKTISMSFKDAQLNDVLKILSQQSGMNFIASQEVSGKTITIYLDNVPVNEALERILASNNLIYELKPGGNIFLVRSLQTPAIYLITRVYRLNYATVVSSKLNQTLTKSSVSGGSSGGSASESGSGIAAAVKAILSSNGKIIEDNRTNSLIITDMPVQFSAIEETIARLDVRIPQILIEVEMLDISKTTADLLGTKFGDTPLTFSGAQRDHVYPFDQNKLLNKGYEFAEPEYRVGTLSFSGLSMTLQFLRTQSDTRNLARPRILTLDNETAEINIKTDEAIGLASVTTSSQSNSVTTAQAERSTTGVFLKVTPQVNFNSSEITMAIEPKVIQARTGQTFSGQTFKDPEERGTRSILRILDGDTIVLGGLLRTNSEETNTKVPVFSEIPVLGAAFRHKDKSETQRELVIFITPHIIQESYDQAMAVDRFQGIVRIPKVSPDRIDEINKELLRFESKDLN